MEAFELWGILKLNKDEFEKDTEETVSKTAGVFSKLGTAAKFGGAAIAATGAAVAATVTGLTSAAAKTAEYGDNIDKTSQKLGVSAEFYQEWDAVLQHSGTSMDAMSATFKTLANASQDASKDQEAAFKKLGLSMSELSSMSAEEVFTSVISGLQGMEEGTERTAIATTLLGRGAMEMGALLNTSAEDTQKMIDRVHELGGVMSNDSVKAAAAFQDSLQDFNTALDGLKRGMVEGLMPGITQIMDGLTAIFAGDEGGLGKIKEGVSNIASAISAALPRVAKAAADILPSVMQAITENLPQLIESGVDIIVTLATAIVDALPTLIEKTPEIITAIVMALINNAPKLIEAGINLIVSLAGGLVQAIPQIIGAIPQIIQAIVSAFTSHNWANTGSAIITGIRNGVTSFSSFLMGGFKNVITSVTGYLRGVVGTFTDIGRNLIQGLVNGVADMAGSLLAKAQEIAKSVIDTFTGIFDQHSPSKVFHKIGVNNMLGLMEGMEPMLDGSLVQRAIDGATVGDVSARYNVTAAPLQAQPVNNTVTVVLEGDADRLFRVIQQRAVNFERATGQPAF